MCGLRIAVTPFKAFLFRSPGLIGSIDLVFVMLYWDGIFFLWYSRVFRFGRSLFIDVANIACAEWVPLSTWSCYLFVIFPACILWVTERQKELQGCWESLSGMSRLYAYRHKYSPRSGKSVAGGYRRKKTETLNFPSDDKCSDQSRATLIILGKKLTGFANLTINAGIFIRT